MVALAVMHASTLSRRSRGTTVGVIARSRVTMPRASRRRPQECFVGANDQNLTLGTGSEGPLIPQQRRSEFVAPAVGLCGERGNAPGCWFEY